MNKNWITIYDSTAEGRIVYVSDSITDCTQFLPEDVIGRTGYSVFHPDDNDHVKKVHLSNTLNERMSSMTTYRHLCKNGDTVLIEAIVIYCYDLLIACNYILDEESTEHKMRISAIDEWYFCIPNGPLQKVASWKVHKEIKITRDQVWINDQLSKPQERRVCLILNRYTDNLNIVYASRLSPELLNLDPIKCLGQSIYDFMSEIDCMSLQVHMDLAKKHDMMFRLRFDWIIDEEKNISEQVEGITSCTDDGLVMILRLAPRVTLLKA